MNRGYLFVRFDNHQNALKALNRINKEEFLLGGYKIQANWADTQNNFDEDEGINVLYIYIYIYINREKHYMLLQLIFRSQQII